MADTKLSAFEHLKMLAMRAALYSNSKISTLTEAMLGVVTEMSDSIEEAADSAKASKVTFEDGSNLQDKNFLELTEEQLKELEDALK